MKTIEINKTFENLTELEKKTLPIKVSLVVSRNIRKIKEAYNDIETKRMELVSRYGDKDENGEVIVNADGNVKISDPKDFIKEFDELMASELDITLEKITMDDLNKCENEKYDALTLEEISALTLFLEE